MEDQLNPSADAFRLGEQLARTGQLKEAESALRQAMLHDPRNPGTVNLLARVLLGLQRATEALHLVEEFLREGHRPAAAELLLLRAQMLAMLRRFPEAISAFNEAILADANNGTAELGLAMALGEDGQVGATEQAARRAISKGADSPGARYVLGRALFDDGRLDEAEAAFREVLDRQVDHSAAHASLAELIWMRSGNVEDAAAALDAVLLRTPELAGLRITKASLLQSAGKPDLALAELESGLSRSPRNPVLHFAAAKAAISVRPARALDHARSGLALVPGDLAGRGILAEALLATDQAKEAAAVASQLLEINPNDNHAIAVMATAWRLEGDTRYPELFDYTSFVKATPIDVPDGWSCLDDYLSDLARCLHPLHGFKAHPVHQSVRAGTQVDHRLHAHADTPVRAFAQAIDGSVRRYMAELGKGKDFLRRRNTGGYRLSGSWSVRVGPSGRHLSHYHGKGWLSSACYIQLPQSMDGGTAGGGWLKFGEPAISGSQKLEAEYFVRPQPGLLVLFPSWMWHATTPFSGRQHERRLTMAFDVIPE